MLLYKKSLWRWGDGETYGSYQSSDPDRSQEEKRSFWKYSSLRLNQIFEWTKVDRKCLINIVKGRAEKQAAVSCATEAVESVLRFFCCNSKTIMTQLSFQTHFKLIANLSIIFDQTQTCVYSSVNDVVLVLLTAIALSDGLRWRRFPSRNVDTHWVGTGPHFKLSATCDAMSVLSVSYITIQVHTHFNDKPQGSRVLH